MGVKEGHTEFDNSSVRVVCRAAPKSRALWSRSPALRNTTSKPTFVVTIAVAAKTVSETSTRLTSPLTHAETFHGGHIHRGGGMHKAVPAWIPFKLDPRCRDNCLGVSVGLSLQYNSKRIKRRS